MNVILNALLVLTSTTGAFSLAKLENKGLEISYASSFPETEHEQVKVVLEEPTLTKPGKEAVVCPICGQVLGENEISPLGPRWGSLAIVISVLGIASAIGISAVIRKRKLGK